ncbi:MAG: FMN-binding domain-containing protein [Piscirickettsiaceae bacterium CG_4_9_14_3_um_filter_43_564]|nr:FMN-binding protein [Thiomicrospira sp.]OIP94158.1 MAG: FMN-binding domain-containing protein [Thiomicrospira sp. CG2_30_44_34]PIQ05357.1 MAG: FMN-binding domain-containing protein [Piscirickettsiaceae bacterium CG18_big_fil_WC_8_21_14_2_50_44_103]PIU38118.1 MAG: FMN-binding domain-containing protein [Piscirickettsiaceae bacterium CG07_land_8_20_14_0_80_44_28]PIW58352.1 MAG: FMN-binding domain-containing protein [Piscirickettsiaceae bacterium CG12_big_fil_rev_8_21_14_0_65_44_934]PIW76819.1 
MTQMKKIPVCLLASILFLLPVKSIPSTDSGEVREFIQTYLAETAQRKFMWLTGDKKQVSSQILSHSYYKIRVPYWQAENANRSRTAKTAWVLEEIGKEKLITIGVVIEEQKIQAVRILKFRESRGWEVKLPSFTQQFKGSQLNDKNQLTQTVDGISGATLSVRAVTHIARLALYLQSTLPNP